MPSSELSDERMVEEAGDVDWHAATEEEVASFGLALGMYRDALAVHENRRVAQRTVVGSNISICVLVVTCLLCHTSPWFALAVVASTQTLRALWLYVKTYQAAQDVRFLEEQSVEVIKELAARHPAK